MLSLMVKRRAINQNSHNKTLLLGKAKKLPRQVLGEHHKDRAEERAARSDAKVRQIFSDNCSCCNPSPFHNYCQHPAPSGQQCNALTQHRLLRCNSLNIFRLPCWSPSWEGWTRPWKVFQIKVGQFPDNNFRIAKKKCKTQLCRRWEWKERRRSWGGDQGCQGEIQKCWGDDLQSFRNNMTVIWYSKY